VIPRFITAALEGRSPTVYGDGEQSRDFCFIENVVEANLRAADAEGASGKVFNIACGTGTSLNRVLALLGEALGRPVVALYEPGRAGDVRHSLADISQAKTVLGYTAAVNFVAGLGKTLAWFQRRDRRHEQLPAQHDRVRTRDSRSRRAAFGRRDSFAQRPRQ